MDSENLRIFLEDFVDFLNGVETSCVKMRKQIEKLIGSEVKHSWNPEAIKWEKAEGFKGEFEKSEDVNSLDFKNMVKDLVEHNGKLTRDSYFYWLYPKSTVVGRKLRKTKTESEATP